MWTRIPVFDPKIGRNICRKLSYEAFWRQNREQELHTEPEGSIAAHCSAKLPYSWPAESITMEFVHQNGIRCNYDYLLGIVMWENQIQHQHLLELLKHSVLLLLPNNINILPEKLAKWTTQALHSCDKLAVIIDYTKKCSCGMDVRLTDWCWWWVVSPRCRQTREKHRKGRAYWRRPMSDTRLAQKCC